MCKCNPLPRTFIVDGIIDHFPSNMPSGAAYIISDTPDADGTSGKERMLAFNGAGDCIDLFFEPPMVGDRAFVCKGPNVQMQPFRYTLKDGWIQLTTNAQLS